MILVTLGTQDKKFYRLLDAIEKQIDNGTITEEVICQAGDSSDYKSKHMKVFDLIPLDEFESLMENCSLLITHGGVGSITTGLKKNKKIIAAPRLACYKEHVNDHQLQIIDNFSKAGYILKLDDFDELGSLIESSKAFTPNEYKSNTESFVNLVEKEIDKYLN